jgi:arginine exporter protein ArgO
MSKKIEDSEDVKEDFCGACAVVPLAIAGVAGAGVGSKQHGTVKKVMLWGGISLTLVSVVIVIIYLRMCKDCR